MFITNHQEKSLLKRIEELIKHSSELKFLVGFFYFSGAEVLYRVLKDIEDQMPEGFMKVLVGLSVDKTLYGIYEYGKKEYGKKGQEITKEDLFNSLKIALTSPELDCKEVYEQAEFFKKLLLEKKLEIRKTKNPNHAKLYIFKLKEDRKEILPGLFITGSSNLTKAGLSEQYEFNVEIKDYGFEEAEKYFDNLWETAIELKDKDVEVLVKTLERETFLRKITPFQAYVYLLKTYLELPQAKVSLYQLEKLMEKRGYKSYDYQLSAVSQAIANCEAHGGCILADVVGLGKTVIACLTAKALGKRGIVICPPHLIGDKNKTSGWEKYLEDFELYGWEVWSSGKLEDALKFVKDHSNIEVVIVDEAHRFRNEKTESYSYLREICRGKTVLLLSATPFNNRPSDIFALLKLFTIPKKSTIIYDEDLEERFRIYEEEFEALSDIKKNFNSQDKKRRERAIRLFNELFSTRKKELTKEDFEVVKQRARDLAREIRAVLEPVVIRRNRLDLKYFEDSKDIELSKVEDPKEVFFELTEEQSKFYDEVIKAFYSLEGGGRFKGPIYLPEFYEKGIPIDQDEEDEEISGSQEEQFLRLQQRNLYDLMRRHIVKRFESSFGAFYETLKNFKKTYVKVREFIEKTGKFIYDKQKMEKLLRECEDDPDALNEKLEEYAKQLEQETKNKRYAKIYEIENFKRKKKFLEDIESDIELFDEFIEKVEELKLLENDPKAEKLIETVENFLNEGRKVVIFTEYADTVEYIKGILEKAFPERVLTVYGNLSKEKALKIYKNFDAQYKEQEDKYQILLTTDKLSEGINLNRAGVVINYDIPWNPVRVIQRLGRINRIGKKVYEEIYILNFFPTEKGADYVKSREIAQTKMFMIHNVLGEDAKIFSLDEEPQPSELYRRLTRLQDEEEESFYTKVKKEFERIKREYPEVLREIEDMPKRVKTAKAGDEDELIVFIQKGKDIFVGYHRYKDKAPRIKTFEEVFDKIKADPSSEPLPISDNFWKSYKRILEKDFWERNRSTKASNNNLNNNFEKARRTLNHLFNNLYQDERLKEYRQLILNIVKDMKEYCTLSKEIIDRIARLEGEDIEKVLKELKEIKDMLGEDFLERTGRKQEIEEEIIIVIENRSYRK